MIRQRFGIPVVRAIDAAGWLQGPGVHDVTPDVQSAIADVDQDGDVDLVDFGLLQRAMTP